MEGGSTTRRARKARSNVPGETATKRVKKEKNRKDNPGADDSAADSDIKPELSALQLGEASAAVNSGGVVPATDDPVLGSMSPMCFRVKTEPATDYGSGSGAGGHDSGVASAVPSPQPDLGLSDAYECNNDHFAYNSMPMSSQDQFNSLLPASQQTAYDLAMRLRGTSDGLPMEGVEARASFGDRGAYAPFLGTGFFSSAGTAQGAEDEKVIKQEERWGPSYRHAF